MKTLEEITFAHHLVEISAKYGAVGLLGEDLSWGFFLLVEFLQALEED